MKTNIIGRARLSLSLLFILGVLAGFAYGQSWDLIWADEFNGSSLDMSKWAYELDCAGGGNSQLQCYTNRQENVRVQNGSLVIEARVERFKGSNTGCTSKYGGTSCTNTRDYTSGRIRSKYSATGSWTYGRFELRAKMPTGRNLWPALWMLPTDEVYGAWAASGEIDILEARGQLPNTVQGTLHYGAGWPKNRHKGSGAVNFPNINFQTGFHIHAVEWEPTEMRWFVDDKMYFKMSLNRSFYEGSDKSLNPYTKFGQPWDEKFHYVINLAVGGAWFPTATYGTFTLDDAKKWENPIMLVDYARVYKASTKPATSTTAKPATSTTAKPATSTTAKPATSTTAKPATSTTAKPATSTTAKPATSTTAKPATSTTAKPATSTTSSSAGAGTYKLVWSDEFTGSTLNKSKWIPEIDCYGGGNGQLQCHTDRSDNIQISNGNLLMIAKYGKYTGSSKGCTITTGNTCTATKEYTSARLLSNYKTGGASWKYAKVEIRAKLSRGEFLQPSFMLLPTDAKWGKFAASGQIDMFENRGQTPSVVENTVHYGAAYPNNKAETNTITLPFETPRDWHVYTFEWDNKAMNWYVDGVLYWTQQVNKLWNPAGLKTYTAAGQPWDQRFHLAMDLVVGGSAFPSSKYGTLKAADAQAWANPKINVDYVRIYQKVSSADKIEDGDETQVPMPTDTADDYYAEFEGEDEMANGDKNIHKSASKTNIAVIVAPVVTGCVVLAAVAGLIALVVIRKRQGKSMLPFTTKESVTSEPASPADKSIELSTNVSSSDLTPEDLTLQSVNSTCALLPEQN